MMMMMMMMMVVVVVVMVVMYLGRSCGPRPKAGDSVQSTMAAHSDEMNSSSLPVESSSRYY